MLSSDLAAGAAVSVPYLKMFGTIAGGVLLLRAALAAQGLESAGGGDPAFYEAKIKTAQFYAAHILPQYKGLADMVQSGAGAVTDMPDRMFG